MHCARSLEARDELTFDGLRPNRSSRAHVARNLRWDRGGISSSSRPPRVLPAFRGLRQRLAARAVKRERFNRLALPFRTHHRRVAAAVRSAGVVDHGPPGRSFSSSRGRVLLVSNRRWSQITAAPRNRDHARLRLLARAGGGRAPRVPRHGRDRRVLATLGAAGIGHCGAAGSSSTCRRASLCRGSCRPRVASLQFLLSQKVLRARRDVCAIRVTYRDEQVLLSSPRLRPLSPGA